ncbi:MAG: hypothetical protein Q9225_007537, partial [Loekoesia sp. 1 TL-2023]
RSTTEDDHTFHLFVRPKDPKVEQWEGSRSGTQAAVDVFNADKSGDIKDIERNLSRIVADASEVYTDASPSTSSTSAFSRLFSSRSPSKTDGLSKLLDQATVKPLRSILNELRNIKSDAEITNMRKAGKASGRAFTEGMRQTWTMEKDLNAFLDRRRRSRVPSPSTNPSKQISLTPQTKEYGNYITDITRTWPISGTFTPPQKDLYNAILATQRTCISLCRATASNSLDRIHQIAEETLKDSLKQLGFDMSRNALETLFPHHLGHYIGLDVHDTPGQSRKAPLQAGQCVTVEPGLYIPDTDRWPAAFRGMGIRIEDSVCVQEKHPLVLTTEAVKEVEDIEALRS